MGCSQTKIMCYTRSTKTEKVQRSKKRQQFMKDAVLAVNKFAAAHSSYANCLVKTGSALTDFAAQFPTTFMEPFIEEEGEEDGEEENMPQLQTKEEVSRHVKGKLSIVEVKESVSVVEDLGDHFVKASKAAEEVSRLLEGTGLHCHSKFTDIDMRGSTSDSVCFYYELPYLFVLSGLAQAVTKGHKG